MAWPSQTDTTLNSATMRDTNKLAISTYSQPCIRNLFKSTKHDYKAYSIGQQRVQSMPQLLAKSRPNQLLYKAFLQPLKAPRARQQPHC